MEAFTIFLQRIGPDLIRGTGVTLQMTAVALVLGIIIGLPVGLARVYGNKWLSRSMQAYIAIFQGTPLLIQLFVVYYGLPDVGLTFSRLAAAFITLGLNSGAYQAEYLRGALQAVGEGQMTAARAIGMSQFKAIFYIVLPQALRLVIPAWSNEMVSMIKYTSVVFLIAVPDLMGQAKILAGRYYNPIEIYLAVAVVYLVLVAAATLLLNALEDRLRIPGLQMDA